MKVWYDTEFHERGPDHPIDLISIGMVREDGAELYLVNADCAWGSVLRNDWLRENVVPSLPVKQHRGGPWLDFSDPRVRPREHIAAEVKTFLANATPGLELWAWYADYDHVVLSQLFGRMIDLPDFVPMYTRDLKQEVDRLRADDARHGRTPMPRFDEDRIRAESGVGDQHDALADAKYCRTMAGIVRDYYDDWTNA